MLCCLGCNYGGRHVMLSICSPPILSCLFHIHPDGREKKNLQHICQKERDSENKQGP